MRDRKRDGERQRVVGETDRHGQEKKQDRECLVGLWAWSVAWCLWRMGERPTERPGGSELPVSCKRPVRE